ncbi:YceI family protein [Spongorhabdus nitratireducens]
MNNKSPLLKRFAPVLLFSALSLQGLYAAAAEYTVNPALSQVSLATIKNQYVVEAATIGQLTGQIKDGKIDIAIPVKAIETGIPIRDSRLNELFFEAIKFPHIKVSGQLESSAVEEAKGIITQTVAFEVEIYGQKRTYNTDVVVSWQQDQVLVASTKPVIISAADFGIPEANLINLAKTVGGIPISGTVPVNFTLVLDKV